MSLNPVDIRPAGPFDRLQSYALATMARVDYLPDGSDISIELRGDISDIFGANETIRIEDFSPAIHVYRTTNADIISVRGTETAEQLRNQALWGTTAHFGLWEGRVVAYFGERAVAARNRLAPIVGENVVSTGHSLGGAIAALLRGPISFVAVTFGSPPIGNAEFVRDQLEIFHLRIDNHGDIVPTMSLQVVSDILGPLTTIDPFDFIFATVEARLHYGEWVKLWPDCSATRPPLNVGVPTRTTGELLRWIDEGGELESHAIREYARRIRGGMPALFPLPTPDPEWPELHRLDAINVQLNERDGVQWELPELMTPENVSLLHQFRRWATSMRPPVSTDDPQFRCE